MEFRWSVWNVEHVGQHGVLPWEAEEVVSRARRPYPTRRADDKWLVQGRTVDGRYFQVVYVLDDDGRAFVIHARPLTARERRRLTRRERT